LVSVPLDGSGAADPDRVREIVGGSRFLAHPRPSPDGTRLAWLAWDHPNMPWDGTQLRVGRLAPDGTVPEWSTVLGGPSESVFQPEWDGDDHLVAVSDRSGWWNLYRVPAAGGDPTPLYPAAEEFGAPLWRLGATAWGPLGDGRLRGGRGTGTQRLRELDPTTGTMAAPALPYQTQGPNLRVAGSRAVPVAGSPRLPSAVVTVDVPTRRHEVVRTAVDPQ